ncbi:hypothetical protein GW17_00017688, partial [Ensete ventricosum]
RFDTLHPWIPSFSLPQKPEVGSSKSPVASSAALTSAHGLPMSTIRQPSMSFVRLQMDVQMDIRQVFGEEFIRQSQLQSGEQSWRSSSSSSSLRSPSAGSPEGSSLLLTKAGAAAFMPDVVLPHQMAMQTYNLTSLPPSSSSSPLMYQQLVLERRHHPGGAFQGYHPTGAVRVEATPNVAGQRMIKKGIDVLRRISTAMMEAPTQEHRPTSDQLHHMISERRRREKLNQNFHALRLLLPPGSKKDKASVLANTKNYLDSLKARVSELQERNQMLELQLPPTDAAAAAAADGVSDSDERVRVEISRSGADDPNPSESQQINLRLVVRDEECDMTDLVVRTLECLKGMSRDVMLASVAASTMSPRKYTCARFNLKLREKVMGVEYVFSILISAQMRPVYPSSSVVKAEQLTHDK